MIHINITILNRRIIIIFQIRPDQSLYMEWMTLLTTLNEIYRHVRMHITKVSRTRLPIMSMSSLFLFDRVTVTVKQITSKYNERVLIVIMKRWRASEMNLMPWTLLCKLKYS